MPLSSPIRLPLRLGLQAFAARRGGVSAFDPATLFASGELGAWYDRGDLSRVFQSTSAATPLTTAGQIAALVLDKSQGVVDGPELVVNGDFDDPVTTGWAVTGGSLSVVAGKLRLTSSASPAWTSYSFASVPGRTYRIAGNWAGSAGTWRLIVGTGTGSSNLYAPSAIGSGGADAHVVATATTTFISIRTLSITVGDYVEIDDITARHIPGNHARQSTAGLIPVYQVSPPRLVFDAVDDVHVISFAASLGSDCTIARSVPGVGASILTGQTIGTSYNVTETDSGIVIVDRALTTAETASLTAYLEAAAFF